MNTKIVGILVCMLLIATALPAVGTMNVEKDVTMFMEPEPTSTDIVWSDNFDSYDLEQFLDGTPDDGGWKCWDDNPGVGAYVVDDQSLSAPHSVDIDDSCDIVHEFSRICSGNWTFTDWVYVPSDFSGDSEICLMSYYESGNEFANRRQVAVSFLGENGVGVVKSHPDGPELPLITGQWVEIRIEIDFEADWFECYYNEEFLDADIWTEGISSDGYLNLAAVNIFGWTSGTTSVYHDDFSLEGEAGPMPDLDGEGSLSWTDIEPSAPLEGSFTVENIGEPNSRLEWRLDEYPDWGTAWSIEPSYGSLTPEDGPTTVEVSFKAPDEPNEEFTGVIKVRAVCDPDDFIEIPVSVSTPVSQESDGLFGWVFLRGLVFNPREDGSRINARAINLHYVEITPQGLRRGVVRLKTVSFRNGVFIKMSEKGLLGNAVRVSGFCHGGIDIQ